MKDTVQSIAQEFFTRLGIQIDSLFVENEDEEHRIYRVTIQTPNSKLLIGIHGQTLDMIKHLLMRMIEGVSGKSILLHIEVNDYLSSKEKRLFRYIEGKIAEVMEKGGDICLSDLSSYERKQVHGYIASKNIPKLKTFSTGEKSERRMHITYEKTSSMDIEADGIGI